MAKKSGRGGKREGAGRKLANPSEGPTKTMAASVPESLLTQLDAIAKQNDWSRSEAVTRAIRGLIGAPKRSKKGS